MSVQTVQLEVLLLPELGDPYFSFMDRFYTSFEGPLEAALIRYFEKHPEGDCRDARVVERSQAFHNYYIEQDGDAELATRVTCRVFPEVHERLMAYSSKHAIGWGIVIDLALHELLAADYGDVAELIATRTRLHDEDQLDREIEQNLDLCEAA